MNDPTCVSLFSGIGGMDHGLARAGFRHLAFCESDAYRRQVLAARWPGVPIHEDVRAFPHSEHDGRRRHLALLCGGFPCQDLSVAGRRAGLEGNRSGLFFEYARIAGSLRPRWLLVENVPGLLSSQGGRDFGTVIGTLADIGYGVAWRVLDSRFFGVPQRRRRVFIVGALAHDDPRAAAERAGQVLAVGARCTGHPATRGETRADLVGTLGGGAGERGWAQDVERMTFVANTMKSQRGKGGGGIGPEETLIADTLREHPRPDVRRLMPVECERLQALPDQWTNLGNTPDSKRYAALGDAVTASVAEWIGRRILDIQADEG